MRRSLLWLVLALLPALAHAQFIPGRLRDNETDCAVTSLNCATVGMICLDNQGPNGNGTPPGPRYLQCDPAADGGSGDFVDPTNLGGVGGGAPTDAAYLVLALDPGLSDERVPVAGDSLTATDGGAGGDWTLDFKETNILRVCKTSGAISCEYSTISSALAAVSGESITNRFAVLIGCGDYDEQVLNPPSYTALIGVDRSCVRLRGNGIGSVGAIYTTTSGLTHFYVINMTVGGERGIYLQGTSHPTDTLIVVQDSIIGINDGSENVTASDYCMLDDRRADDGVVHTIIWKNTVCNSTQDGVRFIDVVRFYGSGNTWLINDGGTEQGFGRASAWSIPGTTTGGPQFFSTGAIVRIDNASNTETIGAVTVNSSLFSPPVNPSTFFEIHGADIKINTTNTARTGDTACLRMGGWGDDAKPNYVRFSDVTCDITAAGSSALVRGAIVNLDTDHDDWTVDWHGGSIALSGGANQFDVEQNETTSGFTFNVADLDHAANYTGAGTVSIIDTARADFSNELLIPRTDTALANRGQVRVPTATDGLRWFDSAERRATADDHVHGGGAGDGAAVPEANVTMDDATGHAHTGAGGNGTIVTDLACTTCVDPSDIAINAVDNLKLNDVKEYSLKGRPLAAAGDPSDIDELNVTTEGAPASGDFLLGWLATGEMRKYDVGTLPPPAGDGVGYDEILDDGTARTKRAQVNFTGGGISCVDNPGATRTDCDVAGGGTTHEILSGTHTDTTPATVLRGALMVGQLATPKWQLLPIAGTADSLFSSDGTDATWEAATGTSSPVRANNPLFPVQVRYTAISPPSYVAGNFFYDSINESMSFHNNESDITLQVGQEGWIRVRNITGSTINNGQVVYINGIDSGFPTIALARADAMGTAQAVGIATHSIETASVGYVTAYGLVRDFNTSAFTIADRLYLSATGAGLMTSTAPSDPNFVVPIAIVTEVNVSTGDVLVTLAPPRPTGGAGIQVAGNSISTLSSEEDFLVSGALTCGSGTRGKIQVAAPTVPLQYCNDDTVPVLQYAAYGTSTGDATGLDCASACVSSSEADPTFVLDTESPVGGGVSGTYAAGLTVDDVQSATTNLEAADDNTTQVASTEFVQQEINGAGGDDLTCATGTCNVDATVARLAGPLFTGDARAATPAVDDNDVSIATTAFVQAETAAAGDIGGTLGGGLNIAAGSVASDELATANKTFKCNFVLFRDTGLKDTDDIETISNCSRPGRAITLTEVICETDAGAPIVQFHRDDGTPTPDLLTSDLTCTTAGASGTIAAAEEGFAATDKLDLEAVTAFSGANRISVLVEYTVD